MGLMLLCGCSGEYVHGLEYCNNYLDDSYGIVDLLPNREFLEKYTYIDGDFHYYGGTFETSKALLYLKFDEETYLEAKEDILSYAVCSDFSFSYNGFVFYQNVFLDKDSADRENIKLEIENWGNWFSMIAYSDEKNTIVSIGYNSSSKDDIHGENIQNNDDFAKFIERYYLEFYNFE